MNERANKTNLYTIFYKGEYIRNRWQNQDPYMHSVSLWGFDKLCAKVNELREKGYPVVEIINGIGNKITIPN